MTYQDRSAGIGWGLALINPITQNAWHGERTYRSGKCEAGAFLTQQKTGKLNGT
jgi:hypothetical protein